MKGQIARALKKEADNMYSLLKPEHKNKTSARMIYRKMKKLYSEGKLKVKK